ncbi:hypothetical protein [Halopiger aswanensis]|uniref:DUF8108 domain-containing protein n=1 Tax=Halopiger aswanensis TaxID=148449 RepID=A0A419VXX8_9EURY|nr:hypothetical protein [Halopiger aswanensis]RKD88082.1 hypothetical protein ATJ93_4398 [Halopiger aswanensis]
MDRSDSYRREVTAKVESGWKIEEETQDRVTLVRREFGNPGIHLIIAILTIWWAMGVPNLLYAAYRYFTGSQRTIVWKDRAEAGADKLGTNTE